MPGARAFSSSSGNRLYRMPSCEGQQRQVKVDRPRAHSSVEAPGSGVGRSISDEVGPGVAIDCEPKLLVAHRDFAATSFGLPRPSSSTVRGAPVMLPCLCCGISSWHCPSHARSGIITEALATSREPGECSFTRWLEAPPMSMGRIGAGACLMQAGWEEPQASDF